MEHLSIEDIAKGCPFDLLLHYDVGKVLGNGEVDESFAHCQGEAKICRKVLGGNISVSFSSSNNLEREVEFEEIVISPVFSYINEGDYESASAEFDAPSSQEEYVSYIEFSKSYTLEGDMDFSLMIIKKNLLTGDNMIITFSDLSSGLDNLLS